MAEDPKNEGLAEALKAEETVVVEGFRDTMKHAVEAHGKTEYTEAYTIAQDELESRPEPPQKGHYR